MKLQNSCETVLLQCQCLSPSLTCKCIKCNSPWSQSPRIIASIIMRPISHGEAAADLDILVHDNVGRHRQHRDSRHECEGGEEEEAEPVEDHRGKLPVGLHSTRDLVLADLVSDHPDLLRGETLAHIPGCHDITG